MGMRHFTGYHGTNSESAEQIIRVNFARNFTVGWLGTGVYFYDDDYEMANYWARDRHKRKIPKVIKTKMNIPKEQILDMTENDSKEYFHEFRKQFLQKQLKKRNRKITVNDNEDLDGKIYNAIANLKGYNLIRAETYTFQDEDRYHGFAPSRVPNSIELCLRKITYIKDKRIV